MAKQKLKEISSNSLKKSLEKRKRITPLRIFTFDSLINKFHKVIETFPDNRASNSSKSLKDAALGGFSIFYTQNPSFLAYQKSMQKKRGKNNAGNFFGIVDLLSENQIRNILDHVAPSYVLPMFSYVLDGLSYSGHLHKFRSFNGNLVAALDGTQFFSSKTICCPNCRETIHSNGSITYSHSKGFDQIHLF